jgi:hypothetical protein
MKEGNAAVFGVAIIWAAVILASAIVLRGTPHGGKVIPILGGGAAATIIVVGGEARR